MKLFIWNEPYRISYGSSICYVFATDVESARELAKRGRLRKFGLSAEPAPQIELGEPTYVVDGPVAEWYEWSE